nr:hypothetical protein W01B11.4c - Caenorhabditis elegans [Caenorhabditis elegans]
MDLDDFPIHANIYNIRITKSTITTSDDFWSITTITTCASTRILSPWGRAARFNASIG